MNNAILIISNDWEGLYINEILVEEGHTLNQGYNRMKHFVDLAKKYNFNLSEMREAYLCQEDINETEDMGYFPEKIEEFIGKYE